MLFAGQLKCHMEVHVSDETELLQWFKASRLSWPLTDVKRSGNIARDKDTVPAAEARKAQGASRTADLIPSLPEVMVSEACVQVSSFSEMMQKDSIAGIAVVNQTLIVVEIENNCMEQEK